MNCEDVQTLLPDYYDDMLSPVSRYTIQNHLKTCEACNKELHEISVLFESIAGSDLETPPSSLKENFSKMLSEEIQKEENKKRQHLERKIISMQTFSLLWKVAAAVIIFLGGTFLGTRLKSGNENPAYTQINDLKNEVKSVKEMMMFKLLEGESASDRIQAVNYVNEMQSPDKKVIGALINTLNHDKNVNVRLASLYSLAKFSDNTVVTDSLVNSLSRQTEPVIQIVLINMLAAKKETRAIQPIRDIISNDKTIKEVKDIAAKKLKTL
jgi:Putative zinc-finger